MQSVFCLFVFLANFPFVVVFSAAVVVGFSFCCNFLLCCMGQHVVCADLAICRTAFILYLFLYFERSVKALPVVVVLMLT